MLILTLIIDTLKNKLIEISANICQLCQIATFQSVNVVIKKLQHSLTDSLKTTTFIHVVVYEKYVCQQLDQTYETRRIHVGWVDRLTSLS